MHCGVEERLADLVLAGAYTGPDEGIRAKVALDVGGDDFSGDVLAEHKPLICARHGGRVGRREEERGEEARRARRVSSEDKGQAKGSAEAGAWQQVEAGGVANLAAQQVMDGGWCVIRDARLRQPVLSDWAVGGSGMTGDGGGGVGGSARVFVSERVSVRVCVCV
jgi:hypothetical protein